MKIMLLSKYALCALVSIGTLSAVFAGDDEIDYKELEKKGEEAFKDAQKPIYGTEGAVKQVMDNIGELTAHW